MFRVVLGVLLAIVAIFINTLQAQEYLPTTWTDVGTSEGALIATWDSGEPAFLITDAAGKTLDAVDVAKAGFLKQYRLAPGNYEAKFSGSNKLVTFTVIPGQVQYLSLKKRVITDTPPDNMAELVNKTQAIVGKLPSPVPIVTANKALYFSAMPPPVKPPPGGG
jgi:hypothetical protein